MIIDFRGRFYTVRSFLRELAERACRGHHIQQDSAARAFAIVIVVICSFGVSVHSEAQVAQELRSSGFRLLGTPDVARGIPEDVIQAQASASRSALAVANQNLVARGSVSLDESYVKDLQSAFISALSAPTVLNRQLYVPTTNDNLLGDPDFAAHLKRLFELQSDSSRAYAEKRQADIRVVGGNEVPEADDVVALVGTLDGSTGLCSGTLISAKYVLTAAHCFCEYNAQFVRVGPRILNGQATAVYPVREYSFYKGSNPCPIRLPTDTLTTFEFKVDQSVKGNDLMIVGTGGDINGQFRWILGPKAFAKWSTGANNYFVKAAGYGFSSVANNGKLVGPGVRIAADIAVQGVNCSAAAQKFGCVDNELVAQGNPAGQISGPTPDTCNGDSGGPIYALYEASGTLAYYTIGVTSRGITQRCGDGGIYSLISTRLTDSGVVQWLQAAGAKIVDE